MAQSYKPWQNPPVAKKTMIEGFTPRRGEQSPAAPGRRRRVRRRRARRLVDGVRSVRPGEEEGRAGCVRGPRLQRVGGRRIDARRAARAVAAVVTGSGRHRHRAGHQRHRPTGSRRRSCAPYVGRPSAAPAWRRFAPARSCWRQPASSMASAPRRTGWPPPISPVVILPSIVDANVLYVDNGRVLTSAGAAAGFDLCIHMVRRDLGADVAASVARLAVMPLERAGGQAQFIEHAPPSEAPGAMTPLLTWMEQNLSRELAAASHRAAGGDEHENTQPSFSRAGGSDAGRVARARARASRAAAARNDGPGHRASGGGGRLRVRRGDARALRRVSSARAHCRTGGRFRALIGRRKTGTTSHFALARASCSTQEFARRVHTRPTRVGEMPERAIARTRDRRAMIDITDMCIPR